ncbi:hypothetical protein [uncultured Roseobacter sp.]|uniref:hypothetical protein n=1 Tax=uncultured Roseobacter sp. TaxID=114847 RepID=UPI002636FA87|nr:hypothetical protein [uncultured Roseobacter sp.]
MHARITKSFRIAETEGTRKYTAGDVAEGSTASWAVKNGYGEKITPPKAKKEAPQNKAESAPENKAS